MLKRPHYIALGLVVLLTLVILNLPSQTTARFKLGIGSLFLPLFGLASSSQQLAGATGDAVVPRRELLQLNDGLRRENQQMRLQAMQAQETASENARLRQLVGWQRQTSWRLKLAKVVLREPANWWRTVQIDLGSRDGLRVNLPVLTTDGLVGRIASVSLPARKSCCWVILTAKSPRGSKTRIATPALSAPPDRWTLSSSSWRISPGTPISSPRKTS